MQLRLFLRLTPPCSDSRPPNAMVDFPTSDSTPAQSSQVSDNSLAPSAYLPFRRISLPSAPNLHRQSVVSTASFDSVPEALEVPHVPSSLPASPSRPIARAVRHRPSSVEASRRNYKRREVKSVVVDEQREAKRRRIIHELHDTERTYLDGLELIYSV